MNGKKTKWLPALILNRQNSMQHKTTYMQPIQWKNISFSGHHHVLMEYLLSVLSHKKPTGNMYAVDLVSL